MISQTESLTHKTLEPRPTSYFLAFEYFNGYFEYRRHLDPQFSFDIWSAELGFKSESYLRMICQGKRTATLKFIEIFAKQVALKADELEHLELIALYHKAKSAAEKKIYLDRIYESMNQDSITVEIQDYVQFLSNRQLPLLKLILAFPDVKPTVTQLALFLDCKKSIVYKNLKIMEKMGLIASRKTEKSKEEFWFSHAKNFSISDKSKDAGLALYHLDTLAESQEALNMQKVFKRFRSIYFSMSEKNFEEFVIETEKFLKRIQNKFGSQNLYDQYIFKLNLNSYPVTEKYHPLAKKRKA